MKRSDFRFLERLRVRWAEIDMQRIVFNGHYLMYIDTAVTGFWRALALPYEETFAQLGGELFVRKATLEYEDSAQLDDLLEIGVRVLRVGNSSLVKEAAVLRGETLLVRGELVYVYADPVARAARPVPQTLRDVLAAFEAGEPMIDVRLGTWDALGREAGPIRQAVLVGEQRLAPELAFDAADASAVHAVAYNRLGMAVATGRLLEHSPGVAQIGRMAVLRPVRGSGIGGAVLDALAGVARARGERELLLHAQTSAVPFYAGAGFSARGSVFDVAGRPHLAMVRAP
jgi:YbgC/YbaW family acyl-CoA thioester hydrolase